MLPFPGGVAGDENGTLILAFAAAAIYLAMIARAPSPKRTLVKAASTGLLAVLAYRAGGPDFLVAALGFSAIGDAALAQDGDSGFLLGLGAFLAAHLCFAWLFFGYGAPPSPGTWAVIGLIAAFAAIFGAVLARRAGPLAVPVIVYVAAIAAMGASAATVGGMVLAGALLFIASDALLGTEKFLLAQDAPQRRATTPAVWVLYWAGQAIITIGILRFSPFG
jgi:uncharacterized membrane protein YhhN